MNLLKSFLIVLFIISSSIVTQAQIALSADFKCVKSDDHYRENYFTNGNQIFKTDVYGREELFGEAFVNHFKPLYPFAFNKTSDGLYVGTGAAKSMFYYMILVPESATVVMLKSKQNGEDFSAYSIALLKMVRLQIKNKLDIYFTDSKGETCF